MYSYEQKAVETYRQRMIELNNGIEDQKVTSLVNAFTTGFNLGMVFHENEEVKKLMLNAIKNT